MKIQKITIENFRAFKEKQTFDFSNYYGKPFNTFLISGPNASGKTTVLDAIHLIFEVASNRNSPVLREGLVFDAKNIVHTKGKPAKITLEFELQDEEKQELNKLISLHSKLSPKDKLKDSENFFTVSLEFPNLEKNNLSFKPKIPVALAGRSYLKQLLKAKEVKPVLFEKIGGVCYFDQRRTVREHKNKRGIFLFEEVWEEPKKLDENIVEWLLEFFNKDFSWDEKQFGKSNWKQVQGIFDKICFPTKLEKMVSGPEFTDIVLKKENGETYGFNQASSGETQVLRFAVGLVVEAVWNSVVLLDELETHLHPEWQVRFLNFLENDGRNNQYLITTHSPFVASKFSDLQHLSLGKLSE